MAIKVGEKDLFPYLGDYGPVNIYKGEQKLAGYKWAEKSGQELHFDNTYKSLVQVEVDGRSYQHAEPTPDYPIEIESVNDFDVVSSVGGRNLILKSKSLPVNAPHEIVDFLGRQGVLKIENPTVGMYTRPREVLSDEVNEGDDYVLSVDFTYIGAKGPTPVLYIGEGYHPIEGVIEEGRFNRVYIRSKKGRRRIHMSFEGYEEIYLHRWRLEKGSTPSPAPEDITPDTDHPLIDKINLNLSEPLRSVGDVKDRIYRDDNDGLWKVERNVGKEVFGETFITPRVFDSTSSNDFIGVSYNDYQYEYGISSTSCSHFKMVEEDIMPANNLDVNISDEVYNPGNQRFKFSIRRSRLETPDIEGWEKWLSQQIDSGTPLVTLRVLKTPTIETLDQEQQHQLNTLKSFK